MRYLFEQMWAGAVGECVRGMQMLILLLLTGRIQKHAQKWSEKDKNKIFINIVGCIMHICVSIVSNKIWTDFALFHCFVWMVIFCHFKIEVEI